MFFKRIESNIQCVLDYSIEASLHQIKILEILRNNLPEFSKDFKALMVTQGTNIYLEDVITQELQFFLNNKVERNGYLFGFQAKGPDILARQFGTGIHSQTLLFIEAKRLPSTSSQDYVKTGIGRFKREEHGKQHDTAAILGYVQENDFNHWHSEINSWIKALTSDEDENPRWVEGDKINKVRVTNIGEYLSKHSRITKKSIILHHFWIDLGNHIN